MTTEAPKEQVHTAVVVPSSTPIKFDVTTAAIAVMKKKADGLKIAGPDDKAGFDAVYETRQAVKDQRIAVEKRQKALKRPHIDYNRDVDKAANLLIDPMKGIEDELAKKEKTYTDERARIAHEKQMADQQRMEGRVNKLRELGFAYNSTDETYDFIRDEYALHLRINFDDIKGLSDEEYLPTAERADMIHESEQKLLADKKERDRLEAERMAAEQKEAADKLAAEQLETANKQAAESKRLADQALALQKRADELDALTVKNRITALVNVGWVEDGRILNSPSGNEFLKHKSILAFTDLQFGNLLTETIAGNKTRGDELRVAEQNKAIKAERLEKLFAVGFELETDEGLGVETYTYGYLTVKSINLAFYSDDEFGKIVQEALQIATEKKQTEADKIKADKARQKRLKSDKEILYELFRIPEEHYTRAPLQNPETQELADQFFARLEALLTEFGNLAEAL